MYENKVLITEDCLTLSYWYANSCNIAIKTIQHSVIEGKKLGLTLKHGKGLYFCELGDFGHSAV